MFLKNFNYAIYHVQFELLKCACRAAWTVSEYFQLGDELADHGKRDLRSSGTRGVLQTRRTCAAAEDIAGRVRFILLLFHIMAEKCYIPFILQTI